MPAITAEELAEIFYDVPKWEHTETGSLRIRIPQNSSVREAPLVASQRKSDDPSPPKS